MNATVKRWLPWSLLALSLGLNVFFLGGWWYGMRHTPEPAMTPARKLAKKLDLRSGQKDRLQQFRRGLAREKRRLKMDLSDLEKRFWQELSEPRPDRQKLEKLLEKSSSLTLAFRSRGLERMLVFIESLDPGQRQRFLHLAKRRIARGLGFQFKTKREAKP